MAISPQLAAEIAALLNARNELTVPYAAERILQHEDRYIIRLGERSELMGVVEVKRVQWYQCEIDHLSVHPDFLRKGVASWLVEAAEDRARKLGARIAQCTIRAGNRPSEGLFKKHGYRPTSTFSNERSGNEVTIYHKVLGTGAQTNVGREAADKYEDKFIAFVDILGFSDLVRQSEEAKEGGASLEDLLDLVTKLGSSEDGGRFVACPSAPFVSRDLAFRITQVSD